MQLGQVVTIEYGNSTKWVVRVTEFSERHHTVCYEVLSTEPQHSASSINVEISLRRVTDDNSTFVEWTTDFSNDVDASVMQDQKYKKHDFFAAIKKTFT